ncbi:MAG: hypothetical protein WDO71_00390 [Bacteroidota bacterium]
MQAIAVRYAGATSGGTQTTASRTTDPALQFGLPVGFDNNAANTYATSVGRASFYDFSQADRLRIAKQNAPLFSCYGFANSIVIGRSKTKRMDNSRHSTRVLRCGE